MSRPSPARAPARAPSPAPARAPAPERSPAPDRDTNNLVSRSVKKPSNENFEQDYSDNLRLINEKYTKLYENERDVKRYIQEFNYFFGQLLELKEVHKKAYPLSTIGLQMNQIDPRGVNIHPLKDEKLPQYFSCLKCCSSKCNGEKRMMAVFQFDDKNKLVDTKLLKYKTENPGHFVNDNPNQDIPEDNFLQISKAFNLRDTFYNDASVPEFIDKTAYDAKTTGVAPPAKTFNTSLIEEIIYTGHTIGNLGAGAYLTMVSDKDKSFKCGCQNHYTKQSSFSINKISMKAKAVYNSGCADSNLIKKIDSSTYEFIPLNGDENKTIFFCYSCKQFFRYDCLRSINEDNDITNVDHCLNVNEDIKNTLVSINSNMLFRKPLFDKEFNDYLETTARTLYGGISNARVAGSVLNFNIHGGLGNIRKGIDDLTFNTDNPFDSLKDLGSSIGEAVKEGARRMMSGGGETLSKPEEGYFSFSPEEGFKTREERKAEDESLEMFKGMEEIPDPDKIQTQTESVSFVPPTKENVQGGKPDDPSVPRRVEWRSKGSLEEVRVLPEAGSRSEAVVDRDISPCHAHHRDISKLKRMGRGPRGAPEPGPRGTRGAGGPRGPVPQPEPQPEPGVPVGVPVGVPAGVPAGVPPGGPAALSEKLGFLQPERYNPNTGFSIDFRSKYGELKLRKTMKDFVNELNKWNVCPQEDKFIQRLDIGYTNYTLSDNDKSKIRPEFIRLQNEYIREFMVRVNEYKNYYPFRPNDFEFLRGLKITGDDPTVAYTSESLSLLGENYKLHSGTPTENIDNINQNNQNNREQGFLNRQDRDKISQLLTGGLSISKKDKINIACGKSFDFNEIEFMGIFAFIINKSSQLRTYLGKLGNLTKHSRRNNFMGLAPNHAIQAAINQAITNFRNYTLAQWNNNDFETYREYLDYYKFKLDPSKLEDIIQGGVIPTEYNNFNTAITGVQRNFLEDANTLLLDIRDGLIIGAGAGGIQGIKQKYEHIGKIISNKDAYKNMLSSLKGDFEEKKNEVNKALNAKLGKKDAPHDYKEYRELITEMCGSKASTFWFGLPDGDNLSKVDYEKLRSLFSSLRILYLPWYDKTLLKSFQDDPEYIITILTEDNIKGKLTSFPGVNGIGSESSRVIVHDYLKNIIPLLDKSKLYEEYRTEVLPLFPLLEYSHSNYQLLRERVPPIYQSNNYYTVTQLNKTKNILSGSQCLHIMDENKHIWNKPKDTNGVKIVTPIKLLQLKRDILGVAQKFYNMEISLNNDIELQKEWKKEYKKWKKQQNKGDGKGDGEGSGEGKGDGDRGTGTGVETGDGMIDTGRTDSETPEDKTSTEELKTDPSLDLSQDKLYTKEDVSKASDELDKLKREMKRREEVLKNIANNIKLLKSQRHGEDSEQRQLQQREYEQKERELILFQKLVEQREEKLKVLKILTNKLLAKDEKEHSEMMRRDEINRRQNFLSLQNEMNSITEKQSREMSNSLSSVQNDEISDLQSKLNNLEGDETLIQRGIVQNGGGSQRDDLRGLLYKTESRKNRTKKKGRKARKNERKKDRSLRKRV